MLSELLTVASHQGDHYMENIYFCRLSKNSIHKPNCASNFAGSTTAA
jgi:hypothetical protein